MRRELLPLLSFCFALFLACASGQTGFVGGASTPFADDAGSSSGPASAGGTSASAQASGDDDGAASPSPVRGDDAGDPASSGADDASIADAPPSLPFDAGEGGICANALAPGDLVIVEILIASLSGTGDHGEWLEVRSTRGCATDLRGVRGECAVGAKVNTFAIDDDLWLPARGSFLVVDSADPAVDHALPGQLVPWAGHAGDVLRNKGSTVSIFLYGTLLDTITYPALAVTVGASLAFPGACPLAVRSDWTQWQTSSASWFPGFFGTPNAPNTDVACPVGTDQ
jgi:hypothetical protein